MTNINNLLCPLSQCSDEFTSSQQEEHKSEVSERYSSTFISEKSAREVARQLKAAKGFDQKLKLQIDVDSSYSDDDFLPDHQNLQELKSVSQSRAASSSKQGNNFRQLRSLGSDSGNEVISSQFPTTKEKYSEYSKSETYSEQFTEGKTEKNDTSSYAHTQANMKESNPSNVRSSCMGTQKNSISDPKTVNSKLSVNSFTAASIVESVHGSDSFVAQSEQFKEEILSDSNGGSFSVKGEEIISDSVHSIHSSSGQSKQGMVSEPLSEEDVPGQSKQGIVSEPLSEEDEPEQSKQGIVSEPLSEEDVPLEVDVQDVYLKTQTVAVKNRDIMIENQHKTLKRRSQDGFQVKSAAMRKSNSHDMFSEAVEATNNSNTDLEAIVKTDMKQAKRMQNLIVVSSLSMKNDDKQEEPVFESATVEASSGQVPESFDSDSSEDIVAIQQPKVKSSLQVKRERPMTGGHTHVRRSRQRYDIENSVSIKIQPTKNVSKTIEAEKMLTQKPIQAYRNDDDNNNQNAISKGILPSRIMTHKVRGKFRVKRPDNSNSRDKRQNSKHRPKSSDKPRVVLLRGNLGKQPNEIKPVLQNRLPMTSQSTKERINFESARNSYANIVPVGQQNSSNFYIRGGQMQPRNQNFMQLSGTISEAKSMSQTQIKINRQQSESKRLSSHLNSFNRKTSAQASIKRPITRITSAMPRMKSTVEKSEIQDKITKDSSQAIMSIEHLSSNAKVNALQQSLASGSHHDIHKKRFQQNRKYLRSAGVNRPHPNGGIRNETQVSYNMSDVNKSANSFHRNLKNTLTAGSIRRSVVTPSAYTQIPSPIKEHKLSKKKIVAAGPKLAGVTMATASSVRSMGAMFGEIEMPRASSSLSQQPHVQQQGRYQNVAKRPKSQLSKQRLITRNERSVKDMSMKDYMMVGSSDAGLVSNTIQISDNYLMNKSIEAQSRQEGSAYPILNFKSEVEQPIKVLDKMIEAEEEMRGGPSVYNRGNKLKLSLIDPEKVKCFLAAHVYQKGIKLQQEQQYSNYLQGSEAANGYHPALPYESSKMNFLADQELHEDTKWKLMMHHFKHNPDDLLEVFPTPKQSDDLDQAGLAGFDCKLSPRQKFRLLQQTHRTREKQRVTKEQYRSVTPNRTPRVEKDRRMMEHMHQMHLQRSKSPIMASPGKSPLFMVTEVSKKSHGTDASSPLKNYGLTIGNGKFDRDSPDRSQPTTGQHVTFETEYGRQLAVLPVKQKKGSNKKQNASSSDIATHKITIKDKERPHRRKASPEKTSHSISHERGSTQQTASSLKQQRQEQIYIAQKLRKMDEESKRKYKAKKEQGNLLQSILFDPVDPDSKQARKILRNKAIMREARIQAGMRDIDPQIDKAPESHMTMMDNLDFKKSQIWFKVVDNNDKEPDLGHSIMGVQRKSKSKLAKEDRSNMIEECEIQTYLHKIKLARIGKPPSLKMEIITNSQFIIMRANNTIENLLSKMFNSKFALIELKKMEKETKKAFADLEPDTAVLSKLERILQRLQRLYHFYDLAQEFFQLLFEREQTFKLLRKQVMKIDSDIFFRIEQNDVDVAERNFDEKQAQKRKMGSARGYQLEEGPMLHRVLMRKYGNKLIEETEKVLAALFPFIAHLNGELNHLHLQEFIFGNTDYIQVITKEVIEVRTIFLQYDMKLQDLGSCIQLQVKSLSIDKSLSSVDNNSLQNIEQNQFENSVVRETEPSIISVNDQQHRQFKQENSEMEGEQIDEIISIPVHGYNE